MPADLLDYERAKVLLFDRYGRKNRTSLGGFFGLRFLTAKGVELYNDLKLQIGKAPKFRGWSHTLHTIYFKWLLPPEDSYGFDIKTAVMVYADKLREAGYEVETDLVSERINTQYGAQYIKLKILNPYRKPETLDDWEVTYELFSVIDGVEDTTENLFETACEELKALVREHVKNGVNLFDYQGVTFDCAAYRTESADGPTVYYGSSGWDS